MKFDTQTFKRSLIGLALLHFRSYPWAYMAAFICLALTHFLQSQIPAKARELGDMALKGVTDQVPWPTLLALCLGIMVVRSLSRILFFFPARNAQKLLRLSLLELFQNSPPWRWQQKYNAGQVFQMVYQDLEGIRGFMGFGLLQVLNFCLACFILIPQILKLNPTLLWAFTPMLASLAIFVLTSFKNQHFNRQVQDQQGEVQNFIIESYHGKKTIKTFSSESRFIQKFNLASATELESFFKIGRFRSLVFPLMDFAVSLSFILGAYLIWSLGLPAPELIFLSGFIFLFEEPLSFIGWIGVIFGRSLGCWQRLQSAAKNLEIESDRETVIKQSPQIPYWHHNLDLPSNQYAITAITGPTGSGKSHWLENMAMNYMLQGKKVSLVAQSPYLYNDSVSTNIFLDKKPTEEDIRQAMQLIEVMALESISDNNQTLLQLEVGENGKKISGGQAKRLCLIRSLMSDADVLLWDDPMSSVDILAEKQIWNRINELGLLGKRQLIMTTHRLSTFRAANYGILLDKSSGVLEQGEVAKILNHQGQKSYEYFQQQMV